METEKYLHLSFCPVAQKVSVSTPQNFLMFLIRWIAGREKKKHANQYQIDGLVQDCSNSSALAMELLQSRTKPSK